MSLSGGELEVVVSGSPVPVPTEPLGEVKAIEGRSLWQIAWRRLKKDKVAMAGGIVAILLALVAVFADAAERAVRPRLEDPEPEPARPLDDDARRPVRRSQR